MKKILSYMLVAALAIFTVSCAEPPTKEMEAVKASVDAVAAQRGEVYAVSETKELNDSYAKALEELKVQDDKFFKDYKKAKELLIKVSEDSAALLQVIPARKETAKKNAQLALSTVEAKIAETVVLLASAPKGKGSDMDIAAMQHDLNGLEESLNEVRKMIQAEDYLPVPGKVAPIQLKVTEIAAEIKTAIDKKAAMTKKSSAKKAPAAIKKSVVKKAATK